MQFIYVRDPRDILTVRDQFPDEDLVFTRIPPHTLRHRGKVVDTAILDFDFTLTRVRSQWHQVQLAHMSGELSDDEDRDRDFYYGGKPAWGSESPYPKNDEWLQDPGCRDLSSEQAAYGTRTMMRWAAMGITRDQLRAVGAHIELRDGTHKLFEAIPHRTVVSFGVEELIESCLAANGLTASVVANRLFYDIDGRVRSHHPFVVVNATKRLIAQRLLERADTPPEHVLCVGDSIGDIEMAPPFGLNVLLLPRDAVTGQVGKWRDGQLPHLWEKVRAVVVSDSLRPVWELVRRF